MDKGLSASMWAPVSANRRTYNLRHEIRARPLPRSNGSLTKTQNGLVTAPATRAAAAGSIARLQSFHRFEQTCRRLRWKFIDLERSYERSLQPLEWGFTPQDAERNFKVDFYEFYAWIEQAIVFLLLVFGIAVVKGSTAALSAGRSSHAYHHNVLKALEEEDNPLHGALGLGDVNQALWKAKELRNRWKDAAEGRETPPLKMYDLRWIVTSILGGLEEAYKLAGREVEGELGHDGKSEGEEGWEWMVESMDWEA